ncbi:hypothetical protein K2173_008437 [Erythroxylum novogranatense]|uniref:Uncharacterized protein n=1 Tax=Erythroxylum novogranatense TaxID=1862640 RepID=A0AAV8U939_9ROSI|nr:hypothetical protein K2173_008437 [Erythroxylum novogranatense]
MEETEKKKVEVVNGSTKLHFNLPLLSIRRRCPSEDQGRSATTDSHSAIPFCWEQSPGKPKEFVITKEFHTGDTPRPKPPPCRWHLQKEKTKPDDQEHPVNVPEPDDGCDADVEEDDVFSDAVEVLSLTEAIDIVQKAEDDLDRLNLESGEVSDCDSPNFMMRRFLPDATALASASILEASKNINKTLPYNSCKFLDEFDHGKAGGLHSSESSPKGCGLEIFLPWRTKHRICGLKSSLNHFSPNLKPHRIPKLKGDVSILRSCRDANK